ncbi:MAG: cellulase family glycosylhydrolase [Myxococcales bacterium]|nr:MAG: cellulase family glycosylhydrolase [Myxococcales bacterium]
MTAMSAKKSLLFYLGLSHVMVACIPSSSMQPDHTPAEQDFVTVRNEHFVLGQERYAFVGANYWYGPHLAAQGVEGRKRVEQDLDQLQSLGIRNLRILAGSEGPSDAPWRIAPAMQESPGQYNQALLEGLDFVLQALAKRGMHAVLFLTNYWFWSGGLAQYLAWHEGSSIPYPFNEGQDWQSFSNYTSRFFEHAQAQQSLRDHIAFIINRRNTLSHLYYRDDPAIMAWELCNEARGMNQAMAMQRWVDQSACFIKSLDPRHLVTTGSEGDSAAPKAHGLDFINDHKSSCIDYATMHLWVENWGWFDPKKQQKSFNSAKKQALRYITQHIDGAKKLGKPIVLEEFGIARDFGSFDPQSPALLRSAYYSTVLDAIYKAAFRHPHVGGSNFWAWGGQISLENNYGEPWQPEQNLSADPPHEPQGWYSVFSHEKQTLDVLKNYAERMTRLKSY